MTRAGVPRTGGRGRRGRRRRFTPFALGVGLICSVIVSSGVAGTYSAFTAGILNSVDTAGAGTLVMRESDSSGATTCTSSDGTGNSVQCTAINKYGGSLQPGQQNAGQSVFVRNIGTLPAATFQLSSGACTVTSNPLTTGGDVCTRLLVQVRCTPTTNGTQGGTTLITGWTSLSSFASSTFDLAACLPAPTTPDGNSHARLDLAVKLDPAAGIEVQGQTATQQLTFRFTAGA